MTIEDWLEKVIQAYTSENRKHFMFILDGEKAPANLVNILKIQKYEMVVTSAMQNYGG